MCRFACAAIVAGLLGGCVFSAGPLLPANEAVNDPELAGRYAAAGQGKLQYWNVALGSSGYVLNVVGEAEKMPGALYKFTDRFRLAQIGPTDDKDGDRKYLYWLLYAGRDYLLVNDIPCNVTVAKELNLPIEADDYSCIVKSRDQLEALARRAADRFLDPQGMTPVLRTNEPQ
jgi:hypothetical protein